MIQNASRRKFLRTASVVSGSVGTVAAPFALNLATLGAATAQTNGYKAIVCLFLYGGNDSSHMVLRTDSDSFAEYTRVRSGAPTPIALKAPGTPVVANAQRGSPDRLGGVTPITPRLAAGTLGRDDNAGKTFALHPSMVETVDLFAAGRLGILSNAGPLVQPMTRAEYMANSVPRPRALGSHNDQQSTWQALGPEGVKVGWGGRLGDLMSTSNSRTMFTSISVSGNAVFSAGDTVFQYQVGGNGAVSISGLAAAGTPLFGSTVAAANLRTIITASNQNLFANEYAAIVKRSVDAQAEFQAAFAMQTGVAAPSPYIQPSTGNSANNGLASQLQTVAKIIAARSGLGANRQVFFVSMGGFDTHDNQNAGQADLLARLSHALGYFDNALATLPGGDMRNQVTLFTASEFGRSFPSNGDGTDHGWGAAHFVYGGAVAGGEMYGRFPQFGIGQPDSAGYSYLPSISVDQIGSTLGRWFGVSDSNLDLIFPNLRNFNRDLGFMRTV